MVCGDWEKGPCWGQLIKELPPPPPVLSTPRPRAPLEDRLDFPHPAQHGLGEASRNPLMPSPRFCFGLNPPAQASGQASVATQWGLG